MWLPHIRSGPKNMISGAIVEPRDDIGLARATGVPCCPTKQGLFAPGGKDQCPDGRALGNNQVIKQSRRTITNCQSNVPGRTANVHEDRVAQTHVDRGGKTGRRSDCLHERTAPTIGPRENTSYPSSEINQLPVRTVIQPALITQITRLGRVLWEALDTVGGIRVEKITLSNTCQPGAALVRRDWRTLPDTGSNRAKRRQVRGSRPGGKLDVFHIAQPDIVWGHLDWGGPGCCLVADTDPGIPSPATEN